MKLPTVVGIAATIMGTLGMSSGNSSAIVTPPFEIELQFSSGLVLQAVILNRSRQPRQVLHDRLRQPSRLFLTDMAGKEALCEDGREAMKFDTRIERAMYSTLPPGQSAVLYQAGFFFEENAYGIFWGPYHFHRLPPGNYTARVEWRSERDDYSDDETGRLARMKNVWKGVVVSRPLLLQLPQR